MAWNKFTPVQKTRPDVPVSISVPEGDSRGAPFLLVDEATTKQLGWKAGATLMLSIGDGEHAGKLRLEPAANEPLKLRPPSGKAKRNRITIGRLPCLGGDQVRSACVFAIEKQPGGGGLGHHAS